MARGLTVLLAMAALGTGGCTKKLQSTSYQSPIVAEQGVKCASSQIHNKFIVRWKDGHITREVARDVNDFQSNFLTVKSAEIDLVEFDHRVSGIHPMVSIKTHPPANWGTVMVKAPSAWSRGIKGQGVNVAVVDTGADIQHPQLASQIDINAVEQAGKPQVDDDQNGYVDDIYGWDFAQNIPLTHDNQTHGTHVSGIIAADPSKGIVQGMAPQAKILPLAFLDSTGDGDLGSAIAAIQYAVKRGVRVINASWGGPMCSATMRDLIGSLEAQGILFVAAAGNDSQSLDLNPSFPASFSGMGVNSQITVGASTDLDLQAGFSNYSYNSVQLLAPGMSILSTIPNNQTATYDGTSMATPFVTGAAALLWSDRPKATIDDIRLAILNGVDHGDFAVQTQGRLDIENALNYLEAHVRP